MNAHTPGPWEARYGRSAHAAIYVQGTECNVAVGVLPRDARLIAAAPDLLAALRGMVDAMGKGYEARARAFDVAEAALAKVSP